MHYYTSGLEKNHEQNGAEMQVIGGYRLAATYPAHKNGERLICADITFRPQLILEGNHSEEFLQTVCGVDPLPEEYRIVASVISMADTGMDCGILLTRLSEGRYYMILDAIYDNGNKDDVCNWLADEMLDDMEFTVLRDHTLISVQGAGLPDDIWDEMPELEHVQESDSHLCLRFGEIATDGMLIAMDNDNAAPFWQKLFQRKDVKPLGVRQYDEIRDNKRQGD